MPLVTLSNVKKAFGNRVLFEDVSFFINERERVGLIGANGTGKTTLLRMIAGETQPDSGSLNREPGITAGYLPQEVDLPDEAGLLPAVMSVSPELLSLTTEIKDLQREVPGASGRHAHDLGARYAELTHRFDTLGGFDYETRARAILVGLGFDESELDKPIQDLSGGQKTRAALARLLLLSPDLLLLDEPTNHLDIQACEWLQEFLQTRYRGAALIVSHDRYFLDRVVSRTVEVEAGTIYTYPGNYSAFAQQKAARVEEQQKLHKDQQKEIARIEAAIQTLFSHRKFSRRDSKVKQLERIERVQAARAQQSISVSISAAIRSGREVLRLSGLAKSYPGKSLFADLDFLAERGRKVGIVGPNGSGKTTLLKIIAGRETCDAGEVVLGHNVKPVYFAQEFDHLLPDRTVLEELLADADLTAREARDLLARFLFRADDAFKKVEVLSGGELCRLALAKVLASGPNLLLLDEPTNHLDIASREALESALRGFSGTVLAASHDRYLLDAIAEEMLEIKDGETAHYLGNYSSYREETLPEAETEFVSGTSSRNTQDAAFVSGTSSRNTRAGSAPETQKQRPVTALRQMERLLRELGKRRNEIEHEIHEIEARIEQLVEDLGNEENYRDGSARELTREYDEHSKRLEDAYAEWSDVCDRIAETTQEN